MLNIIIAAGFKEITTLEILAFLGTFIPAIIIDLKLHKAGQRVTMSNAAIWSLIWVLCSVVFGAYVFYHRGPTDAGLYATGYLLEKALAIDNLFAFFLIFKSFDLIVEHRQHLQHRILYWGILGAVIFRIIFLSLGALVVDLGPTVLIVFGLIILWTVKKMWTSGDSEEVVDYTNHWSVNLVKRFMKVDPSIESGRFFSNGATPLFLCLVCIEVCDVVFAFDSMPVIVAVVKDPYLMITSSLWAAAGLRSLYFLLVAAQDKFWALNPAIMLLLVFVAAKLIMSGAFHYHLPNAVSLSVIGTILAGGIVCSLLYPKKTV